MDTMDLGLAALTGQPHAYATGALAPETIPVGNLVLGLAAIGIAAAALKKKGKKGKYKHKHMFPGEAPDQPTEEDIQHVINAVRSLRGEERQQAEALLEAMTPEELFRHILGLRYFIRHSQPPKFRRHEALKAVWPEAPVGTYRGLRLSPKHPVARAEPGTVVDLPTQRGRGGLSSWTEDYKVAREFAGNRPGRKGSPVIVECVGAPAGQTLLMTKGRGPGWFEKVFRGTIRRWLPAVIRLPAQRIPGERRRLARQCKDKSILKMSADEIRALKAKQEAKNLFATRKDERECILKAPVAQVRVIDVRRWDDPRALEMRKMEEQWEALFRASRKARKAISLARGAAQKAEKKKVWMKIRAEIHACRKTLHACEKKLWGSSTKPPSLCQPAGQQDVPLPPVAWATPAPILPPRAPEPLHQPDCRLSSGYSGMAPRPHLT
jgi:hypothetical protein